MVRWLWDLPKAAANIRKHGISFELAARVLGDPWRATRLDRYPFEERWQTIGRPSSESTLTVFVVHTWPAMSEDGEEEARIISARLAEPRERRSYEEGKF